MSSVGSAGSANRDQDPTRPDPDSQEPVIEPIPSDPITDRYPLLAHLNDEDDGARLEAFSQVLQEMRGELDRLSSHADPSHADRPDHQQRQQRRHGRDREHDGH